MLDRITSLAVRAALIGGSLADRSLFWARAALGRNQLALHECTPDGAIAIGGVSEQIYGEGFLLCWHEVLERELGARHAEVLYEVGRRAIRWEVEEALEHGVWVPALFRPLLRRGELLETIRRSPVHHAFAQQTLRIFLRMILTEGGWGRVESLDLRSTPIRLVLANAPEPRRLGHTGRCSCYLTAGACAGYFGAVLGREARVEETTCRSRGDRVCTFEVALGAGLAA